MAAVATTAFVPPWFDPHQPRRLEPVKIAPDLMVWPRSTWAGDDRPPLGPLTPEPDVRFLLVHHSASTNEYQHEQVATTLQEFHRFHTSAEKGWPDIAYNFMVDRLGGVWEARQGSLAGAVRGDATGGNQGFSQLVCLIGDFTAVQPSAEAQQSLVRLLAFLADRAGIDPAPGSSTRFVSLGSNRHPAGSEVTTATITGHRTMSLTSCPGDAYFPMVETELARRVEEHRRQSSTVVPSTVVPPGQAAGSVVPAESGGDSRPQATTAAVGAGLVVTAAAGAGLVVRARRRAAEGR